MPSKADQVLLRAEAIAFRRVQGETWPQIATWLRGDGLDVTDGQVRVYWHRRFGSAPPAQVLASASARAWEERAELFQQAAVDWEAKARALATQLASAEAKIAELTEDVRMARQGAAAWRKQFERQSQCYASPPPAQARTGIEHVTEVSSPSSQDEAEDFIPRRRRFQRR